MQEALQVQECGCFSPGDYEAGEQEHEADGNRDAGHLENVDTAHSLDLHSGLLRRSE